MIISDISGTGFESFRKYRFINYMRVRPEIGVNDDNLVSLILKRSVTIL